MDFKENINLSRGSVEVSQDWFKRPQRSFFGIVLYYRNKESNNVEKKYFDFISEILTHDTRFVNECLDIVLSKKDVLDLNLNSISFWLDNGPSHFRTYELLGKLNSLKKKFRISLNYFVEYHGKSTCDSHFSLVSRFYNWQTSVRQNFIQTTESFMEMLRDSFSETKIDFYIEEYKRKTNEIKQISQLVAKNFSSFHHFKFGEYYLQGSLQKNSDKMEWNIQNNIKKKQFTYKEKVGFHRVQNTSEPLLRYLKKRIEKREELLRNKRQALFYMKRLPVVVIPDLTI